MFVVELSGLRRVRVPRSVTTSRSGPCTALVVPPTAVATPFYKVSSPSFIY